MGAPSLAPQPHQKEQFLIESSYRRTLAVTLTMTAWVGGCSLLRGGGHEEDAEREVVEVVVVVENRNWQDVTVYALRGGARVRLGTVTSMQTARFVLSTEMTGSTQLRLMADPVGSLETFTSEPVRVEPGDQVQWRLANQLVQSAIFVFGLDICCTLDETELRS